MLRTLNQLWHILTPLDKRKLIFVLVLVIIMAFIEAAGVLSIMPFLAVLANPNAIETNAILGKIYYWLGVDNKRQFIVYLGLISLFTVVFSAAFKIITGYALNRFSSLQRHYFSTRLLKIYLQQRYDFFIQRNSSTLIKNVLSEADQLVGSLIQPALAIISYGIVIFAMVGILLCYDPAMAIITASVLLMFYVAIFWMVKKKLSQIGESFTQANTERYQSCQEVLGGIKDVIINHAQQGYIEKFEHYSRIFARHIATRETLGSVPLHIVETVGYGCLIILAMALVMSGKEVSHILPILGLYGFAAYRMLPAAQNIYRAITQVKFSENIFYSMKREFELEHAQTAKKDYMLSEPLAFEHEIRLENVSFAYPSRPDKLVLQDFNLTILKNSSIGIAGKSGCGKSTLMDIMLGLLQPQTGRVLVDGVALTEKNYKSWHHMVGYVPQIIYLADKSVAENIAFGIPFEEIDMQAVQLAAQQAHIDEFVTQQLADGYDTLVGERGVMLSGGQRQRLGIARTLYKNPQVIFMDEATSALDMETEQAVNEAIQKLNGQKTMVIIAHRESAVAGCDRILHVTSHTS